MRMNPTQINQKYQEFECQSYAFDFNNKMDIYSKKQISANQGYQL